MVLADENFFTLCLAAKRKSKQFIEKKTASNSEGSKPNKGKPDNSESKSKSNNGRRSKRKEDAGEDEGNSRKKHKRS